MHALKSTALAATLALAAAILALVAGEVVLRLLTDFPITEESNLRPHDELLYTADPAYPDIDANGFRNAEPLRAQYDVVAIGDSHTYGNNAEASASWPVRLAAATGLTTYNMGMGGYSIYQYDVLFDRAFDLHPVSIVVTLYPANDWLPECPLLRLERWRARIAQEGLQPPCAAQAERAPARRSPGQLVAGTAIGSAVSVLMLEPLRNKWLPRAGVERAASPDLVTFRVGGRDFSFGMSRLQNHSRGTDLSSPGSAAAYNDGLILLRRWRDVARSRNVDLAVVIIPSKEVVLRSWAEHDGLAVPDSLRELTENEVSATRRLAQDLHSLDIRHVNALPFIVLRFGELVRAGEDMYPPGLDGHPHASGYAAYAEAIATLFAQDSAATASTPARAH